MGFGEIPLSERELDALTEARSVGEREIAKALADLDPLEGLAYAAGVLEAVDLDGMIRELRDAGVWWTSIAWALGEISDPADQVGCLKAGRRVSSGWRRREKERAEQ